MSGPIDAEVRVIPQNRSLGLGGVVICSFVKDFGEWGNDEKAVGETGGDPKLAMVFGAEEAADPLAKMGGIFADIYGYVKDGTHGGADQLALGLLDLVVESAQDVLGGAGVIVLDEIEV